jgi:phosphoribosyl 1,2-cyclic phosphate phosphodiesterase
LFTHSHADHVNGIDDLRGFYFLHKEIVPCYGSAATLDTLQTGFRYIFHEHEGSGYTPILEPHVVAGQFELYGLTIIPIPLLHGKTTALGYRIGNFAYLTDCSAIPDESHALLEGLELLVIDGLRWNPHPFHFNIETVIAATKSLNSERTVLTHLTHDVLFSDGFKLPQGYEFACDGMMFDMAVAEIPVGGENA